MILKLKFHRKLFFHLEILEFLVDLIDISLSYLKKLKWKNKWIFNNKAETLFILSFLWGNVNCWKLTNEGFKQIGWNYEK